MKKAVKLVLMILTGILLLVTVTLLVSFIFHRTQLSNEDAQFTPSGRLTEVNGHNIHVFDTFQGDETLVFMSGGATPSPVLDFKSLYSLLSENYRIVVIEKAGYGFSDVTDSDRDIDTILSETRESLQSLGIESPYILFPHSMSGIEALYWAQQYPKEVKAIVGLDMSVPAGYEHFEPPMPIVYLTSIAANTGMMRWSDTLSETDAVKYGTLSSEDKDLHRIIFYRRTLTENMINEIKNAKLNAQKIQETSIDVPMLLFSSNGENTGMDNDLWIKIQESFAAGSENRELIPIDAPHYIHNFEYDEIARHSSSFIESLDERTP
ncbi:alpha/beta hydrolase [Corticicoccus populi]|uniref:Alpha/beta hydrolase n=1 Tax=Corticicoccus populi TaxID=1812821 RepID=A0ABW5WUK5_9STAP